MPGKAHLQEDDIEHIFNTVKQGASTDYGEGKKTQEKKKKKKTSNHTEGKKNPKPKPKHTNKKNTKEYLLLC